MRIVFFLARSDQIGGAHIHVRDLSLFLKRSGHIVSIIIGGYGFFVQELLDRGLTVHSISELGRSISFFSDLRSFIKLRSLLLHLKPDILSLHSAKAGFLGRICKLFLSSPPITIFTAHGWSFSGNSGFFHYYYSLIEFFLSYLSDQVITVCNADYVSAISIGIRPSRVKTIYNGMPDLFGMPIQRANNSPLNLLMIARFEPQKDHETLLLALSRLNSSDWCLTLVGDGFLLQSTKKLANFLGISNCISFVGRQADVSSFLERADLYLLSSKWEGFPRSIIEALSASLPVIASDVGGVAESVHHGSNGYLFNAGDVDSLTMYLQLLLDRYDLRESFSVNSRELFVNNFTFETMASNYLDTYKRLLSS